MNLTWRQPVRPNGVIIGYIISYKDVTSDEVWQREANPSQLWITLTELKPAKTYEFSVQAKTKNGTGQPKKRTFNFTLCKYHILNLLSPNVPFNYRARSHF